MFGRRLKEVKIHSNNFSSSTLMFSIFLRGKEKYQRTLTFNLGEGGVKD